jgi:hypothetical protein
MTKKSKIDENDLYITFWITMVTTLVFALIPFFEWFDALDSVYKFIDLIGLTVSGSIFIYCDYKLDYIIFKK